MIDVRAIRMMLLRFDCGCRFVVVGDAFVDVDVVVYNRISRFKVLETNYTLPTNHVVGIVDVIVDAIAIDR